eukprot:6213333-Pleurochrysis_carterae.AAC.3
MAVACRERTLINPAHGLTAHLSKRRAGREQRRLLHWLLPQVSPHQPTEVGVIDDCSLVLQTDRLHVELLLARPLLGLRAALLELAQRRVVLGDHLLLERAAVHLATHLLVALPQLL